MDEVVGTEKVSRIRTGLSPSLRRILRPYSSRQRSLRRFTSLFAPLFAPLPPFHPSPSARRRRAPLCSAPRPGAMAAAAVDDACLARVRALVRARSLGVDASHDFAHVARVEALGARLAAAEGRAGDAAALARVRLACLLHDVEDYKYRADGDDEAAFPVIRALLAEAGVADAALQTRVCEIVRGVSFHGELASASAAAAAAAAASSSSSSSALASAPAPASAESAAAEAAAAAAAAADVEAACVRDADRLDAIGAVGIARCFTFGGARGRALYATDALGAPLAPAGAAGAPPSREEYMRAGKDAASRAHFDEKLLLLKARMRTRAGRAMAERRHSAMEQFLEQFDAEVRGEA